MGTLASPVAGPSVNSSRSVLARTPAPRVGRPGLTASRTRRYSGAYPWFPVGAAGRVRVTEGRGSNDGRHVKLVGATVGAAGGLVAAERRSQSAKGARSSATLAESSPYPAKLMHADHRAAPTA